MPPDQLNATFFALSSELRRRMLDVLKKEAGCTVGRLCEAFAGEVGRHAVMKHLAVLERGGLLVTQRQGREKHLWLDVTPLQLIHERWTSEFSVYWAAQLTQLKYSAEGAQVHPLRRVAAAAAAPPVAAQDDDLAAPAQRQPKKGRHG